MEKENIESKTINNKKNSKLPLVIILVILGVIVLSAFSLTMYKILEPTSQFEPIVEMKKEEKITTYANNYLNYYLENYVTTKEKGNMQISSFNIKEIEEINETNGIVRAVFMVVPRELTTSYFKDYGNVNGNEITCDVILTFNIMEINDEKIKLELLSTEKTTDEKIEEYRNLGSTIITNIEGAKNPVVPAGFKKVDTDTAKWESEDDFVTDYDKGLVIEDEKGNQFVWVPIDNKVASYTIEKLEENVWDDNLPEGVNSEKSQIAKYGGFYIARYEAGVAEDMQETNTNITTMVNNKIGIPVSKKGVRPWDYIEYKKAKQNAESMYNSNTLKSGLLTNAEYKAVLNWLENTGYELNASYKFGNYNNSLNFTFTGLYSKDDGKNYEYADNIEKNSVKQEKGNAVKDIILSCGAADKNVTNNIYDLFGNLHELTTRYGKGYCEAVGGTYNDIHSITKTNFNSPTDIVGFRVVLYML